jgi:hypothetical protein
VTTAAMLSDSDTLVGNSGVVELDLHFVEVMDSCLDAHLLPFVG